MLLHITTRTAWAAAQTQGYYHAPSLDTEGFIHCSRPEQVLLPANAMFRGQTDLVLLCLDPTRLQAPVVDEDCYASGQTFPHLYGRLNLDAVTRVVDFPPGPNGEFVVPPGIG